MAHASFRSRKYSSKVLVVHGELPGLVGPAQPCLPLDDANPQASVKGRRMHHMLVLCVTLALAAGESEAASPGPKTKAMTGLGEGRPTMAHTKTTKLPGSVSSQTAAIWLSPVMRHLIAQLEASSASASQWLRHVVLGNRAHAD